MQVTKLRNYKIFENWLIKTLLQVTVYYKENA